MGACVHWIAITRHRRHRASLVPQLRGRGDRRGGRIERVRLCDLFPLPTATRDSSNETDHPNLSCQPGHRAGAAKRTPERQGSRNVRKRRQEPQASTSLRERAFTHAPIAVALLDLDRRWIDVNNAWCKLLGYTRDEMLSLRYSDIVYADDAGSDDAIATDLCSAGEDAVARKQRYRHRSGHAVWVLIRSSVISGTDGLPAYLVSYCESLDDHAFSDTHLMHLATHDPLTGLANRTLLGDRLRYELGQLHGRPGVVSVLVIDLDALKRVNDTHGHSAGDQVILAAAGALLDAAHPGDTVARIGGDEFALVRRTADVRSAQRFRDHIVERLKIEVEIDQWRMTVHASVGLAITEDFTTRPEALLHNADQNMRTTDNVPHHCAHCRCSELPTHRLDRPARNRVDTRPDLR
ncbi:diguanylate cyclase domain-containing protein [Saccharopolyspora mangrovi]|uniref:Diguanylate cyclase n=1 Tax=Saccharopolyspora mangrovi TaxID=3082379 RepID=A0ABU6AKD4_9PSEU|nr:diguanylate cyclase [Saccharopolyspora sp. S2-29]MEB3371775.1 diguanylate cyclase [Saccharopolyspora sp. S2-29]